MTLQEKFDSIMNSIESLVGVGEEDIPNAVAREAGLNLRQLADSFQFMTDMTLIKYIRRRRLVHALDARIALGLSVEEVVSIAGFSDAAAFSKACKNEFDLSPAQIDRDVLSKYAPLSFALVSSGKNADQMENSTLITTMKENTICGISVSQFATVKQMLEISAVYGFNDEETEFVYRLSEMEEITVKQAADFFEDFRMQIENGSIVPGLDIYEMAELACKYSLSFSQAQEILFMLEKNGYHSIRELPECFFDIYFSRKNEEYAGWSIQYICEIAGTLEEHGFSADDLDDIADLASTYGISVTEVIEDYDTYYNDWNNSIKKLMHYDDSSEDPLGFGYRSIWELDEGQQNSLDILSSDENDTEADEDMRGFDDDKEDELTFLSRKYGISLRDAQEIMNDLNSFGYSSIYHLPKGFFEIYFHDAIDQFVGWDIPYVCEIAEAIAQNNLPMYFLNDVMYLASEHNADPVEIIEQFDYYLNSYNEE